MFFNRPETEEERKIRKEKERKEKEERYRKEGRRPETEEERRISKMIDTNSQYGNIRIFLPFLSL